MTNQQEGEKRFVTPLCQRGVHRIFDYEWNRRRVRRVSYLLRRPHSSTTGVSTVTLQRKHSETLVGLGVEYPWVPSNVRFSLWGIITLNNVILDGNDTDDFTYHIPIVWLTIQSIFPPVS